MAGDNASTEEARSKIQAKLANHHEKAAQGYSSLRSDSQKSKESMPTNHVLMINTCEPLLRNKVGPETDFLRVFVMTTH